MPITVEVTGVGGPPNRAVLSCTHDLARLLERRVGPVERCEVRIDEAHGESAARVRVELRVASRPLEVRLTLLHDSDVYIALERSFEHATGLLAQLRKKSSPGLLRKLTRRAAGRGALDTHPISIPVHHTG
jgi:hypothetical protein